MTHGSGRIDKRVRVAGQVDLLVLQSPGTIERAKLEDVSPHGARVVTANPLRPHEPLLLSSGRRKVQTYARVVYCEAREEGGFSVGLQFEPDD